MQGNLVETSVVAAFDAVYDSADLFDVVVLIRGGGATSDLASFDSYKLGSHLAQFPLPVICGIGHQRDNTIPDMIAHTRVNTPTAAADFLIERMHLFELDIDALSGQIFEQRVNVRNEEQMSLLNAANTLSRMTQHHLLAQQSFLAESFTKLGFLARMKLNEEAHFLNQTTKILDAFLPENVLKKGYALITKNGKYVTNSSALQSADEVTIVLGDGSRQAIVK